MLLDRFRKKKRQPYGSDDSSLETTNLRDQVPEIDETLSDIDQALKRIDWLERQNLTPQREREEHRGCCCC